MELNGRVIGLGIELLIESNYKVWRTYLESYLIGKDLWEVVSGDDTATAENNAQNVDSLEQWTQNNDKEEFVLKTSISHALFFAANPQVKFVKGYTTKGLQVLEVDIVHLGKRMYDLYMLLSSSSSYTEKMCIHKKKMLLYGILVLEILI
jgi:hypothetical protein